MTLEDRLHAHAVQLMQWHATDRDLAVDELYKVLEGEPELLFALFGARSVRNRLHSYLAEISESGLTGS